MIKLTGFLSDNNRNPTDQQIDFELHEDLVEMIHDGKYYFQIEDSGYHSEIAIDGKVYLDIKEKGGQKKRQGITLKN